MVVTRATILPVMRSEPVVVPRWIQLVLLPLAIIGGVALLRAAGAVLLLFVIAGLIALLLNPAVSWLHHRRVPRGISVLLVYLALIAFLTAIGILISDPVSDQVANFRDEIPGLIDDANDEFTDLQAWLDRNDIDLQVQESGQTALETLGDRVAEGSAELVNFTREVLRFLVEASIAIILVIVLSVYMLLYGERIGAGVRSVMPTGDGTRADDFPTRIQAAVFGYVRGQILFSTIMGASAGVLLYVAGRLGVFEQGLDYVLFFGIFFGLAELIPYVGPAIGAAPPLIICLISGEPGDALILVALFTALQQVEGHIVAPNVFAQALRINPLLVIFALLLGGQLYGFIGAFISLPIAAIIRETVVYLRRHTVLEPWGTPAFAGLGPLDATPAADACPECDADLPPGAAVCPACGTELADPDAAAAAASSAPG
jgi:predicted PurR-regulated permease PerM